LAHLIVEVCGSRSPITIEPLPTDDPTRRCPDITLATTELGWSPKVELREGLARTMEYLAPRVMAA
jgi:nucleoside-diphosphate-sugar epimerase